MSVEGAGMCLASTLSVLERRGIKREAEQLALALSHFFPLLSIEERIKGEESMLRFLRFCGLGFPSKKETPSARKQRFARRYDREFKRDAMALVQSGR